MPTLDKIIKYIKDNTDGSINLSSLGIEDDDMSILIKELRKKQNLYSLNLQRNNMLSDISAALIATLPLQALSIRSNDVCDEGLSVLLKNTKLLRLDIGKNGITDASLNDFLQNKNLIYVNLQGNDGISESTLTLIKDHIKKNLLKQQQNEERLLQKPPREEIKESSKSSHISSKNFFSANNIDESKEKLLPSSDFSSDQINHKKNNQIL